MTIRPAEHFVHGVHGPIAIFDAEVCAILDRLPDVRRLRKEARGRNPRLDQALLALRLTGLAHTETSATGSKVAPVAEPSSRSSQQLNDDTVAPPPPPQHFSTSQTAPYAKPSPRSVYPWP